jgi:hypothetical protein
VAAKRLEKLRSSPLKMKNKVNRINKPSISGWEGQHIP